MRVTSNKTKLYFTFYVNGAKYRTVKLTRSEFQEMQYNTIFDWINFLRTSQNYYNLNK
jgi:hypothetical protein